MTTTSGTSPGSFLPPEFSDLIIRPVTRASIAATISSTIVTLGASFRVPVVAADPAAGWTAEGAEISPSDASLAEAVVAFKKVAALSIVSNELLADASPEAAQVVGDGLSRDIATKLDAAYFAATTTNGPSGLKSLATTTVSAGGSWDNIDAFTEAQYAAEGEGATLTSWIAHPSDALSLSTLKTATDSAVPLLTPDVTKAGRRAVAGVPLLTSTAVTAGEVWGVPQDRVLVVIRNNVDVVLDSSVYFTSDRAAIRATMRVGFAFPHPLAIVKVTKA